LSGGDYPARNSFAFGDGLEPLRALLSTRASRAYVAIERAERKLETRTYLDAEGIAPYRYVKVSDFRKATVGSRYYPLPLGWAMSSRTGNLIAQQSGRFWDCEPTENFTQAQNALADTDCVQLLTYHELNRSMDAATSDIIIQRFAETQNSLFPTAPPRLDHDTFLACYEKSQPQKQKLMTFQVKAVEALLRAWDRHPELDDDRWFASMMGSLAHDSADFRLMNEFLSFGSAERIRSSWSKRFPDAAAAAVYVNNPKALANFVYGYAGNPFGNVEADDGWTYRQRGIYRLIGREQYAEVGRLISMDLVDHPDLVLNRDVGAAVAFAWFFKRRGNALQPYFNATREDWDGARGIVDPLKDDALPAKKEEWLGEARQAAGRGKMFLQCMGEARKAQQVADSDVRPGLSFFHRLIQSRN
jgi:predicted chitinase